MSEQTKQGLFPRQALPSEELAEIETLATLCNNYEQLDMKLNWDVLRSRAKNSDGEINDFLYYQDGKLVGYLALFSFNANEAEMSGMVHPEYRRRGIFTQLFHAAHDECKRRGIQNVFLIVEHTSFAGQAFIAKIGAYYHHSEYKMKLEEIKPLPSPIEGLQLRAARADEMQALAHITAVSFDLPESSVDWYATNVMENSDARYYYVAALYTTVVGKVDVVLNPQEAVIYGFGVSPEYQRRGYGRQLLSYAIQQIRATGQSHIALEVVVDNEKALSLYHSCGFLVTTSFDYYQFLA